MAKATSEVDKDKMNIQKRGIIHKSFRPMWSILYNLKCPGEEVEAGTQFSELEIYIFFDIFI